MPTVSGPDCNGLTDCTFQPVALSQIPMAHLDLSKLTAHDNDKTWWHAVVETPRGSHNKYDYEPETGCFKMAKTLPEGMTFPFDFGFVPSTIGDDGDPLDVLILMDFAALPGVLLEIRFVGGIEAKQRERNGKWVRNDRLVAVARHARTMEDVESLRDVRSGCVDEIIAFFEQYNKLDDKKFKLINVCNAKKVVALVHAGMRAAKKK